jgi:phosphoesterase RecJ-like protein
MGYAEKTFLNAYASANCENIYRIAMELLGKCTDEIAECVYTGIVTDSGCFKYGCTTAETHAIASELMKNNNKVAYSWITRHMMDIKSRGRVMLEQEIIKKTQYFLDDTCAVVCITLEMMEDMGVKNSDLEGIAGILLQIENIKVGITMKEKAENVFKISMRSPDEIDVSEICKIFGGGGHVNAAGCKICGNADEIIEKLVEAVRLKTEGKN